MILAGLTGRRTVEVPCTVDVEKTFDSFHAYVDLGDFEINPGDEVLVHAAPTDIGYGEHIVCESRATVTQASLLERLWTKFAGRFEITDLYEVGFSDWRTP